MRSEKEDKQAAFPDKTTYIGNIWGWKFSFFGLVLILSMLLLMFIRLKQIGQQANDPTGIEEPEVDQKEQ